MKRTFAFLLLSMLIAAPVFSAYIVVLKDGTRYEAKEKWTVVNGKAIVKLANGQSLQLDPALIDVARSEQATKSGFGTAAVLDLNPNAASRPATTSTQPASLGAQIKLRPRENNGSSASGKASPAPAAAAPPVPVVAGKVSSEVLDKFDRAFENIGIFEKSVSSTGGRSIRAEMTVDTEERVFNAISAASFLMVRNAGVQGAQIDLVELYMRTTNGGAAGRFQMTREDAQALDAKAMSEHDYFVRKVIY